MLNIQVNFPHQPATNTRTTLKVSDLITRLGYKVPTTADELVALAQTLEKETALHPLGDLGGGLSWPIPMSQPDQKKIIDFLSASNTGVPGLPLPSTVIGTLGYLLADSSVSQNDPLDPAQLLQRLLDTPKARALGKALQEHLGGISSETSIYDYLLTAIHIGLDPGSYFSPIRNTVDGFGLAQPTHWGRSPSSVVEALRQYLAQGRVPPGSAKLAAHILLSKEAPQFLIKDIPEHVTVGSLAWANLTIAAAAIEAERPGSVASMSFAEVMSYPVNTQNPSNALQRAQAAAMMDWGVANGIITRISTDNYTPQQIDTVRTAFNQQLTERLTASQALDKEIPTRKEIALKELKERFGDLGSLFEEKVLGTDAYSGEAEQTGLAGEHSMLDIAMMGLPNLRPFVSSNPRIPLEALNKNRNFDAQKVFDQQFAGAIEEKRPPSAQ
ncbi:hypothetical protein LRS56_11095 [Pseudomonas poae]|nr:hypothetical protein LRS56_11095 [Pseudomonas poae]